MVDDSFNKFATAINKQFEKMAKGPLFLVNLDKDELWNIYLDSFPEGTNDIYITNRHHDCSCCRNFVKEIGAVVAIIDDKPVSIWSCPTDNLSPEYQTVTAALKELVESIPLMGIYIRNENDGRRVSQAMTPQRLEDGRTIEWNHFHCLVPEVHSSHNKAELVGRANSQIATFKRGVEELSVDALKTVQDLIASDSLYRGTEHSKAINQFLTLKEEFNSCENQNIFLHTNYDKAFGFRNSVIGTLVQDISNGEDLEKAVRAFEAKVAPENYKRTSAVITKGMIENATKKIAELGIEDSLPRRHAHLSDISVNDVLFADYAAQAIMKDPLTDLLMEEVVPNNKPVKNPKEISWEDFKSDVLPKAHQISAFVKGALTPNLVNLTAPVHADAPNILRWNNMYAWSYNGGLADSGIKQRVKSAGGNVNGVMRFSLGWYNSDDLDIHVFTPKQRHIFYGAKTDGECRLDVDMNVNTGKESNKFSTTAPVENVTWENTPLDGEYQIKVHNYTKRNSSNVGCEVEIENNGVITSLTYPKTVVGGRQHPIAVVTVKNGSITNIATAPGVTSTESSKEVWGIKTEQLVPIDTIMLSPNYWESGNKSGNQHVFFMLRDCKNPENIRGLYNEYLLPELNEHRKVFEVLGSKLQVPVVDEQLGGLGFSSTVRKELQVQVRGDINSDYLIKF